uniref:Fibronectin type-III domain-containing protein n=1 Tax=Schistocephalus solidus TaxID=70667 RepID=A0A183TSF3_SCHSO
LVSATATVSLHTQTTVVANCWVKDVWPGVATCILSGLKDFTLYDVLVKVCICPKDALHLDCLRDAWCSEFARVGKRTLPGVPDSATVVRVQSRRKNSLSVYWTNPTATHGVLSSSKAVAILNDKTEGTCSGIPEDTSPTSCSLNGLKAFTNYTVRVHICVYPVEEEPGYWAGDGCSSNSPIVKQTLPGEVSWLNPDATHGPLANVAAICFWQGKKLATCQADILPGQAVICTPTKLMDFEDYAILVEFCVAPAQAGFEDGCDGGGGCSRTPTILGSTLPGGKAFIPPRILHLS